jgi:O-antigen biosynthesis protein WbqP
MYQKYVKRILDVIASVILITIFFVPMIFVALSIKLNSKGPVIFKQLRYGKDKIPFMLYKFRTMNVRAPANLPTNTFSNSADYITLTGKLMRKFSIDELPQIFNVLSGKMSFIGPRPVILVESNLIELREKHNANSVRPGITGWAQANGRDELNDVVKADMDGYYIDNFGLKMDFWCLIKTIKSVVVAAGQIEGHERKHDTALKSKEQAI